MDLPISYIIPTLNEERWLSASLQSIKLQPGEKELIVVDGGSQDATIDIARDHSCRVFETTPNRGNQMNVGASQARLDYLLFLHADTTLPPEASLEVRRLIVEEDNIAGSFPLKFDTPSVCLRFYAKCSRINNTLFTYGDQGLFVARKTFLQLGGFKPLPILEDVDLQRRLRQQGRFAKSDRSVRTSARRFIKKGPFTQQLINVIIVGAYHCGVSPHFLAQFYSHVR